MEVLHFLGPFFEGLKTFLVHQFPLYLKKGDVLIKLSNVTTFCFYLSSKHIKRPQLFRITGWQFWSGGSFTRGFSGRKIHRHFNFEKRAPGLEFFFLHCKITVTFPFIAKKELSQITKLKSFNHISVRMLRQSKRMLRILVENLYFSCTSRFLPFLTVIVPGLSIIVRGELRQRAKLKASKAKGREHAGGHVNYFAPKFPACS